MCTLQHDLVVVYVCGAPFDARPWEFSLKSGNGSPNKPRAEEKHACLPMRLLTPSSIIVRPITFTDVLRFY